MKLSKSLRTESEPNLVSKEDHLQLPFTVWTEEVLVLSESSQKGIEQEKYRNELYKRRLSKAKACPHQYMSSTLERKNNIFSNKSVVVIWSNFL